MGVRLELTLLWYKCCCFSNVIHFVIMPTTYWSLSQQGHLQPYSKSKAWQLSTQLWSGLSGSWDVFGFLCQFRHFPFCSFLSLMNQRSYLHEREGNHVITKMLCIKLQIIELYLWKWHIALHLNIMAIWYYLYLGIQQWCLDSDANSSLHKEDEIDSLQCSLNAAPKMKVPGCLSILISADVKFIQVNSIERPLFLIVVLQPKYIVIWITVKNMWMSG